MGPPPTELLGQRQLELRVIRGSEPDQGPQDTRSGVRTRGGAVMIRFSDFGWRKRRKYLIV